LGQWTYHYFDDFRHFSTEKMAIFLKANDIVFEGTYLQNHVMGERGFV
jgi:hypothetical protein